MSNEDHKQPNENANGLGSALRDLGQQLIPRVQEFERTLRELMVAAKPYLAILVKNVKALPARTANVQRILARRGWFIPRKIPAMAFMKLRQVAWRDWSVLLPNRIVAVFINHVSLVNRHFGLG